MSVDPYVLRTAALCIVALCVGGAAVLVSGKPEFRSRLLVWLVAAPIVLVAAVVPHGFIVLAAAIGVVGGVELARLVGARRRTRVVALAGCVAPLGVALAVGNVLPGLLLGCVLWPAALLLALPAGRWMWPSLREGRTAPAAVVALGLVGLPVVVLAVADPRWVLATLVAVSLGDVAGFAGGHAVRPLAARRGVVARALTRSLSPWSPTKTVAGAIASVAVGAGVLLWLGPWWLAPVVPVWGVIGDLRESRVKRLVGVKDAGRWLPGFGGLLDRVDSTLGAMTGVAVVQTLALAPVAVVALGGVLA